MKHVGIIVVRKQWNNAPSTLIEGIKRGISELILNKDKSLDDIKYVFSKFTIHNPHKLYISPKSVSMFDILLIPIWIGRKILNCNLKELKETLGIKIVLYTGTSPYIRKPPFDYNLRDFKLFQGQLSDKEWQNLNSVDKFLVVKKKTSNINEIEVGCGQFNDFFDLNEKSDVVVLDFCKQNWDEKIYSEFSKVSLDIKNKCNVQIIQLGKYPSNVPGSVVFDKIIHYKNLCDLYSRSKIWIAMNESFGYPILENKYAGNLILMHEDITIPDFHIYPPYIKSWNEKNIIKIIKEYLNKYDKNVPFEIQKEFKSRFPEFISWENTARKITNVLSSL